MVIFLFRFHFCLRARYFSALSLGLPLKVYIWILRTLVSFLYLGIFVPFVGASGPGVMYSSRSILCTAYAMFVASPSFPALCTVQQRAAIPA